MDKLSTYRQPVVTASGIFIGFILNFTMHWMTQAFTRYLVKEIIVAISVCVCISLLIIVLYRILRIDYPRDRTEAYYKRTLKMFIIGISTPFLAILIIMIGKMVTNVFN